MRAGRGAVKPGRQCGEHDMTRDDATKSVAILQNMGVASAAIGADASVKIPPHGRSVRHVWWDGR